jgi:tetratricopeptide (TPR) repeat protein
MLFLLFFSAGCSGVDKEARTLLNDVKKLYSEGKELEKTSYSDALKKYVEASVKLDMITSRYPESGIARDLSSGKEKLDTITADEFGNKFIPSIKFKADAEASPAACALLYIPDIKDPSVKTAAVVKTARSYFVEGSRDKAKMLLGQAVEIAEKHKTTGRFPPYLTGLRPPMAEAAAGYCACGMVYKALHIIEKVNDPFYKSVVLADIGIKLHEQKKTAEALKVLKKASVAVEYEKDLTYRTFTLLAVAKAFIKTGNPIDGEAKLKEAAKLNGIQDSVSDRILVLKDIALAYSDMGKKTEAVKFLGQAEKFINKEKNTPWKAFLQYVASINYAEIGMPDKAVKLALEIKDDTEINRSLLMIEEKTDKNNIDEKAKVLKIALDQANRVKDSASKSFCIANIGEAYAKEDIKDSALKLIEESEKTAMEIKDKNRKSFAMAKIAQAYAMAGKPEKTEEIVDSFSDKTNREELLTEIALVLAENKKYDSALLITEKIAEPANKAEVLAAVALKMAENKYKPNENILKSLHVIAGQAK